MKTKLTTRSFVAMIAGIGVGWMCYELLAGGMVPAAWGQGDEGVIQLTGTLKKINATKAITIGYREASVPFSYLNAARQPIGYSIDICLQIVEDVRAELGDDTIQVKYMAVNTKTRIPLVVEGGVDLECRRTTNNGERRKQVAFSPIIFVSGTKLLVKRSSKLRSYRDLRGRTSEHQPGGHPVAHCQGKPQHHLLVVQDNAQAFDAVDTGKADAWAGDDAVLFATLAEARNRGEFSVLDEFLSYDPYAIMYRNNDPQFSALVEQAFERLAETRELARIYDQWFLRKLPSGRTLGIAMSPQLVSIFESLGAPKE